MTAENKISMQNLLFVSGNGRNSGKTLFVRKLIEHFVASVPVTAVKISPHFHWVDHGSIMLKTDDYIICEEKEHNQKDSSLMLQSGADRVFFMMVKQENLAGAFKALKYLLPPSMVICESGGLHEVVQPGLHFFVKEAGSEIKKDLPNDTNPIVVRRSEDRFDFDLNDIGYSNNIFSLKKDGSIQ